MSQNPLAFVAKNAANAIAPGAVDPVSNLMISRGGQSSKLNITAAVVVKAAPGRLARILVIAPGTSTGALTINDLTNTTGGAAGNEIISIAVANLAAGQVIDLDWPCAAGIAVTAVPGGSPVFSISYT